MNHYAFGRRKNCLFSLALLSFGLPVIFTIHMIVDISIVLALYDSANCFILPKVTKLVFICETCYIWKYQPLQFIVF